MKTLVKNEWLLWIIVLLPLTYLLFQWNTIPAQVPLHWNLEGEVDRYGNKNELLYIVLLMPALIYFLLLIIPKIDPKQKIQQMGHKYQIVKLFITIFISAVCIMIIYISTSESLTNPSYLLVLIGFLFTILGNYLKTIKPNYFIGIRTPWTLENEVVWKKTHELGGKIWFIGGILIVISSLNFNTHLSFIIFGIILIIITLIPVIYSFIYFKKANT
jgi:uncharacterized membrane protein